MKNTTEQLITLTLRSDDTIPAEHIEQALALLRGETSSSTQPKMDRVLSRREVQQIFGFKSPKSVDEYANRGAFRRIKLPGSSRSVGFSEESVRNALSGHTA